MSDEGWSAGKSQSGHDPLDASWNEKPLGWVHVAKGPVMAGAEEFKVKIIGKGGHGAIPEVTVDPIVCRSANRLGSAAHCLAQDVSPRKPQLSVLRSINAARRSKRQSPQEVSMEGTIRNI